MNLPIAHQDGERGGTFFMDQHGSRMAELTYVRVNATLIDIDHVRVDPSIEGKGVGRSLLNAAVQWARENQTKIHPTCPFAVAIFRRDASLGDVLSVR